jgi:hypothetical protein
MTTFQYDQDHKRLEAGRWQSEGKQELREQSGIRHRLQNEGVKQPLRKVPLLELSSMVAVQPG